jgi:hypothetical protein
MTSFPQHDVIKAAPVALARRPKRAYLTQMLQTAHPVSVEENAAPVRRPPGGVAFGIAVGSVVLAAAILLGASVLWIHYGTAVFFEMIASGIAACF